MEFSWDAVGALAEMLGAIAVLVTLVYLATQIKQTNDISTFNTMREIMVSFENLNNLIVTDSSLRAVLHKTSDLTNDEEEQLYTFVNMFCNTWVTCQAAHDNGLIIESFYMGAVRDVSFELERWSNFRRCVNLWLDRYPEFKDYPIFTSLLQDV